jgi:hypothetical protein
MKIATFLFVLLAAGASMASVNPQQELPQFSFNYSWNNEVFSFKTQAPSFEEALPVAAEACFKHFRQGRKATHDEGLDIIDICVNPQQSKG